LFGLLAAVVLAASARPAAAVPDFTPENNVIASTLTAQSIVPIITGGYRMYLTSGSYEVVSASSTNLVDWTLETGIRLTTSPASVDTTSITAVGVHVSTNADFYRMYYVGISSIGHWSILSATSTDGLTFGKESDFKVQVATGAGFIGQLYPFDVTTSQLSLFYIADVNGANTPSDYRVFSATSTDGGLSFSTTGVVMGGVQALGVAVSTLTDGRTRLFYTQPLSGNTTAGQVLSAISTNGLVFTAETGVRLSTASPVDLGPPIVLRSTESYRWRLFSTYTKSGSTVPFVSSALTRGPIIDSFTPARAYIGQTVSYSISGEVFNTAAAPTVQLSITSTPTFNAATVATTNDLTITGTFNLAGFSSGNYRLFVTNPDGVGTTLAGALSVQLPPGSVTVTDNLFRPLKGGQASIEIQIFQAGDVKVQLFTVTGGLVTTLYDGPMPSGSTTLTWPGRTSAGNYVASGVYLLSIDGPGIKTVKKIVVIK
jgi:hypothetical protein